MTKNPSNQPVSSDYYSAPFKKLDKSGLVKIYADKKALELFLTHFKNDFNLRLEYESTAIYPSFIVYDSEKSVNVTQVMTIVNGDRFPSGSQLIAYKRADELLDSNGVRLNKSKQVKRLFEYIKVGESKLAWVWYKIKLKVRSLFKKTTA